MPRNRVRVFSCENIASEGLLRKNQSRIEFLYKECNYNDGDSEISYFRRGDVGYDHVEAIHQCIPSLIFMPWNILRKIRSPWD